MKIFNLEMPNCWSYLWVYVQVQLVDLFRPLFSTFFAPLLSRALRDFICGSPSSTNNIYCGIKKRTKEDRNLKKWNLCFFFSKFWEIKILHWPKQYEKWNSVYHRGHVSYPMLRMTHPSRNFFVLSLFCVYACLYG